MFDKKLKMQFTADNSNLVKGNPERLELSGD